jgi:replicative DNA helicase
MNIHEDPRDADERAPSALEAEQALIGAVLFDNAALRELEPPPAPEAFTEPLHGRLWAAILELTGRGVLAEPVGLKARLAQDPSFQELGGVIYLADLVDHAPPTSMARHFAGLIADAHQRRRLIGLCAETARRARTDGAATSGEILTALEAGASAIAHGQAEGGAWEAAGDIAGRALAEAREGAGRIGLSTGLRELDGAIGGLRKGQMIVVAGRPAMGKSSAGLQIAKAAAAAGRGALFFSLEMPPFDLGLRLACDVTHDPMATRYSGESSNPRYFDAARAQLTAEQWRRLDGARDEIARWPLHFDCRPGLKVSTMAALARRRFREWERQGVEPGVVVVDHLTIARPEVDRRGNRVAEVGDISRRLAEMAKDLDAPVVALCQLSREVERRDARDRRPQLSDLRWSGEIEQDARVVAFLYRPEYYLRAPEGGDDEAEVEHAARLAKARRRLFWLIEKNNNGPTGQVETYCDIACSAIRDRPGEAR